MEDNRLKAKNIRDIARLANVSTATVSRVINNPESTSVQIRERVLKVIEETNYVPNFNVQSVFSGTSNTIAIFVFDMTNPFFLNLLRALNRIALEHEYTLIICDTENDESREAAYMKYCQGTRTAGIIITEGTSKYICDLKKFSMPVIFMDRFVESLPYPSISSDNFGGIKMAGEYLQNLNHSNIGYVAGPDKVLSAYERLQGYVSFMEENGYGVNPEFIFKGQLDAETGKRAMDYFLSLKNKPTAVICANDLIAQGMIIRAHTLGLNIPDDMSIIGFDGIKTECFYPKLTSIEQDVNKLAEILIMSLLEKRDMPRRTYVPVSLLIGDTCKRNP